MNELIEQMFKSDTNAWLSIASLFLGILGIFLAVIFYFKSKRFKRLSYEYVSRTLIDDVGKKLEGLAVTFNNVPQPRVTISRLALWNSGTDTINSSDLASSSPIQLKINKKNSLLDLKIITLTSESTKFEVVADAIKEDENNIIIPISFEYLDTKDGAVIQLVHNGKENIKIDVAGKIKGSQRIKRLVSLPVLASDFFWFGESMYLLPIIYLIVGAGCFYGLFYCNVGGLVFFFIGIFSLFIGVAMISTRKNRIPISLSKEI